MKNTAEIINLLKTIPEEDRKFLQEELKKMIDNEEDKYIITIDEIYLLMMLYGAITRKR